VVAAVVGGEELVGVLGIAGDGIEVDDCVEVAGGSDPLVDGLAVNKWIRTGVVVSGADVGCDGSAVDLKAVGMGSRDELLICGDYALDEGGVVGRWDFAVAGQAAEIVDTFEDDEPADTGGGEDIAIETSEGAGAEAVDEEVVATDALVGDSDGVSGGTGL